MRLSEGGVRATLGILILVTVVMLLSVRAMF